MKTLQNNFTTPEQSKRLLELGVPADSADMYFQDGYARPIVRFANSEGFFERNDDCSPCWSVGRLIEIANICGAKTNPIEFWWRDTPMDDILFEFDNAMDFSKLEE